MLGTQFNDRNVENTVSIASEVVIVQVTHNPAPAAGPTPFPQLIHKADGAGPPQAALTPNPYGISDQIVRSNAANAADHMPTDMYGALRDLYNATIGDDLHVAGDSGQPVVDRLLHAGSAAFTVLTLPGGPETLGLKLAGKEVIKGGVEQATYHALDLAGNKTGKLVIEGGANLKPDELKVGAELARRGHEVVAVAPATAQHVKTADFLIDGKPTELKTISNVKPTGAARAVTETIKAATKQAKNVVIYARDQRGLTEARATQALVNAVRDLPKSRIGEVRLLGQDGNKPFEIVVKK